MNYMVRDTHIVYTGNAMQVFLRPCLRGVFPGYRLLQKLYLCSSGYTLVCTLMRLFEVYILLSFPKEIVFASDEHMDYAFGGFIVAHFYLYRDHGTLHRIPMIHAVDQGLVRHALNTYQILERLIPGFNAKKFHRSYLFYLILANCYYLNDMDLDGIDLDNKLSLFDPNSYSVLPYMIDCLIYKSTQQNLKAEYRLVVRTLYQIYNNQSIHKKN
jgi:hypothetical protein